MSRLTHTLLSQAVTTGPNHHFFGYYDKSPWDATGQYLLALEVPFADRPPNPNDSATIGLVDLTDNNRFVPLAETSAWNWQQGTMLQWLSTAPDRLIVYNDRYEDQFVAVIYDVHSGQTRTLPRPIYAISHDGKSAISLNFSRVHQMRPGYGYVGVPDPWGAKACPEEDGIYWMDLTTGENRLIISLGQIASVCRRASMDGAKHWFNHLLFSPNDTRFIFLHRWGVAEKWRGHQMFTARPDGTDIYCVNDDMVSHFDWYNSQQILAWARRKETNDHYYLFTDESDQAEIIGDGILTEDGHCSYSPNGQWILTDTYPDKDGYQTLLLYHVEDEYRVDIGRFSSVERPLEQLRCDLHPRWSRDGTQVCFDSTHERCRQVYTVDVGEIVAKPG